MKKSFCKLGLNAAKALIAISVCGAVYSCKDDYKLDDETPSWLGSSVYEYMEQQGNYNNFINLINDLNYKEVLARTGSKTLFVADDDAFNKFYQDNPWGVHSYADLTMSQKKLLLNTAMINNAYLLEMMSSRPAGGDQNAEPEKGLCLRRETASDITDSIPMLKGNDLPVNYSDEDIHYWDRFRDKGLHLVLDATTPMITHFLAAQLATNDITDKDFSIIAGTTRDENDAFIYDCKVIEKDITCQNGYLNKLDRVLVNPQNMGEVIRTNGESNIFSHLLDRFSAPFYNASLTQRAKDLYGEKIDSVFEKRYFALRSQGNSELLNDAGTDPKNNPTGNVIFNKESNKPLPFDPGWNAYQSETRINKDQDMGVIFCPTDKVMMDYFFKSGGRFLIAAYAPEYDGVVTPETTDMELVFKALDKVPRSVIRAMVANLMKESFNASVPSKFETIKNSAQDAMFNKTDDYHRNNINKVLLANNGIVYLMNEVITPAEYAAVSAPAYVGTDKRIFNWAIQSASLGSIPTNYYAYLLAMSARFSFFVPSDENFWYIDPLSFYAPNSNGTTLIGRAYNYNWDEKKKAPVVTGYNYNYDLTTGTGSVDYSASTTNVTEACFGNRLKDMLETHTIIHEAPSPDSPSTIDETQTGVENDRHFFVSKNGSVIKVKNANKRENGMTIQGGWQMSHDENVNVTIFDDKSEQANGYGNGFAYTIDTPMQPSIESVYSALYNNPDFHEFLELCQTDAEVLREIGVTTTAELNKFNVFVDNGGIPCYDKTTGAKVAGVTNIRFFNNYRYTVYVPNNDAINDAITNRNLPTWQKMRDILELDKDPEDRTELTKEEEDARNLKVKTMAEVLVNFIKYHFQDNSVFVDTPSVPATGYETATMNSETQTYYKLTVSSSAPNQLKVKDAAGNTRNVTSYNNIIVRDYITKKVAEAEKNTITSSSSAVVHGIDGILDYMKYNGNKYSSVWESEARMRAFHKAHKLQ